MTFAFCDLVAMGKRGNASADSQAAKAPKVATTPVSEMLGVVSTPLPAFHIWRMKVLDESRAYYESRSENWMTNLYSRCKECAKHPLAEEFTQQPEQKQHAKMPWHVNPKEACDKFDVFVSKRQLEGGHSPKVKRERVENLEAPPAASSEKAPAQAEELEAATIAAFDPEKAEELQAATAPAAFEPEQTEELEAAAFEPVNMEESKAAASEPEKIEESKAAAPEPGQTEELKAAALEPEKIEESKAAASEPEKIEESKAAASEPANTEESKAEAASAPAAVLPEKNVDSDTLKGDAKTVVTPVPPLPDTVTEASDDFFGPPSALESEPANEGGDKELGGGDGSSSSPLEVALTQARCHNRLPEFLTMVHEEGEVQDVDGEGQMEDWIKEFGYHEPLLELEDFNAFLAGAGEAEIDLTEAAKECKEVEAKMKGLAQKFLELKKHPLLSEFSKSSEIQAAEKGTSFPRAPDWEWGSSAHHAEHDIEQFEQWLAERDRGHCLGELSGGSLPDATLKAETSVAVDISATSEKHGHTLPAELQKHAEQDAASLSALHCSAVRPKKMTHPKSAISTTPLINSNDVPRGVLLSRTAVETT